MAVVGHSLVLHKQVFKVDSQAIEIPVHTVLLKRAATELSCRTMLSRVSCAVVVGWLL